MAFFGAIETFERRRIAGWVRWDDGGERREVALELRLRDAPALQPAERTPRGEGEGFVFRLPEAFHAMPWGEFVGRFEAVVARVALPGGERSWRVPMFKSVLLGRELVAREEAGAGTGALLGTPARGPGAPGSARRRLAVFTLAQGRVPALPLWARHHAAAAGAENLVVLAVGPDAAREALPEGVAVVRLPALPDDPWATARVVGWQQRLLLEAFDAVAFTPPDGLLCAAPELARGRRLGEVLAGLGPAIASTASYELWHDPAGEAAYDAARPLLVQRRLLARTAGFDRPAVARVAASWQPGLGRVAEPAAAVAGLVLLRLGSFDLDLALSAAPGEAGRVAERFRAAARGFAAARITIFDPQATLTVAPDWMREAIEV